jgi:replicative DNA helicase
MRDLKPPQDIHAERALLGAIILDNSIFHEVASHIECADFYKSEHQTIAQTIWRMLDAGVAVDAQTLTSELRRHGKLEEVGGDHYLARLIESTPHASNAIHYATTVHESALKRRLIEVSIQIQLAAYLGPIPMRSSTGRRIWLPASPRIAQTRGPRMLRSSIVGQGSIPRPSMDSPVGSSS